jgi:hypothetical protein
MKTIQWVIDSIKIEDRNVARFGKHHLTARGAAEHATYRVRTSDPGATAACRLTRRVSNEREAWSARPSASSFAADASAATL